MSDKRKSSPNLSRIQNIITPAEQRGTQWFEFSIKVSLHPLNWRKISSFIETRRHIPCLKCEFYFITSTREHKQENISLISGFTPNLDFLIKANFILRLFALNSPFQMAKQIIMIRIGNVFASGDLIGLLMGTNLSFGFCLTLIHWNCKDVGSRNWKPLLKRNVDDKCIQRDFSCQYFTQTGSETEK